ncbi:hypothetical protein [Actinomycetospora lemnae]|uniref:Secreted protein n=1 Tax=Actinomycetospora lemnae TaxID=3019891 RepID=A0ABT5SUG1_9PSEU|nr:hypothetical protein [Actinomycetospora sp. DW7H6]MDD7966414.1 hypothetical protein [Actinomycetospora sp. DW7H6]
MKVFARSAATVALVVGVTLASGAPVAMASAPAEATSSQHVNAGRGGNGGCTNPNFCAGEDGNHGSQREKIKKFKQQLRRAIERAIERAREHHGGGGGGCNPVFCPA